MVDGGYSHMEVEPIRKLAESAVLRAQEAHGKYLAKDAETVEHQRCMRNLAAAGTRKEAQEALNDAFYWFGHANAYKGVIAMIELATVVEDELDAEGSCP